jgi:phosphotransferase system HPr (HPr) family protein
MEKAEVSVRSQGGLHLRKAAEIVRCAQKFRSAITLCHKCKSADACSILQVLCLGVAAHSALSITATGPDEKEAVESIVEVFNEGAGI